MLQFIEDFYQDYSIRELHHKTLIEVTCNIKANLLSMANTICGFTDDKNSSLIRENTKDLLFKINEAKVGSARLFHLTGDSATNFEVVAGIYTTSAKAQAQIDKLTAANFAGFSIKPVTGKFAVVLPGLTNSVASAMVTKINAAGLGLSRVKQLL